MGFLYPLPPDYILVRFPSHRAHERFATLTGAGSFYQERGRYILCGIHDDSETRFWAEVHGAKRVEK